MDEWNGVLRSFQRIVRLYRDDNLRRDEMKDASLFRHALAGYTPTLASGLKFRCQRR